MQEVYWAELEEGKQGLQKPKEIRLPAEAEWVIAAGGEESESRFAWGTLEENKDIVRFGNTSESRINRTTPVWMYPLGMSTKRVMDLSGNVFEWQANFHDKDGDYLSLRGGSWGSDLELARVLFRSSYSHPIVRSLSIGFRVVALPSKWS